MNDNTRIMSAINQSEQHIQIQLDTAVFLILITWNGLWSSDGSGKLVYFDILLAVSENETQQTAYTSKAMLLLTARKIQDPISVSKCFYIV